MPHRLSLLFQFLLVQLKALEHSQVNLCDLISIPSGTIKRLRLTDFSTSWIFISIPSGTIKSLASLESNLTNMTFQFLLVQLKAFAVLSCHQIQRYFNSFWYN